MYTHTKHQILEIINKYGQIQVKDLVAELKITQASIHRALNKLMDAGQVEKKGHPPKVFYFLKKKVFTQSLIQLPEDQNQILSKNYLYIDPTGLIIPGLPGLLKWMNSTNNHQKLENCVQEYCQVLTEALSHKNKLRLIDATERFQKIFNHSYLDQVYYFDFYSLIKFGKTKMGQLLLHGKQAQDKKIIAEISATIKDPLIKLCRTQKIEAIAWVPHSIPRKLPFLKEVKKNLNLPLPEIEISKAYQGPIPIAQKSLAKLDERIQNARETMNINSLRVSYKNVLIIDDAVGSGATLNEVAHKLKDKGVNSVIGFAIVGSYKGFEVIKEV